MPKQPLDARTAREVAFRAGNADPRTVQKLAAGLPVRGHVAERIDRALRELGLPPSPTSTAPSK